MTKLSEILKTRERLVDMIEYTDHVNAFQQYADHLRTLFETQSVVQQPYQTLVANDVAAVKKALEQVKERCQEAISQIDLIKRDYEVEYYENSEKLNLENEKAIEANGPVVVFNNVIHITDADRIFIEGRLGVFTDYRMPALILRPANDDFINKFVAFDPLYLVDISEEVLKPALAKFNEVYQRRLRKYAISESNEKIFADLPQNQFAFCFAHSFFNLKTVSIISKYFKNIFDILRPGGIFAFTFCNADKSRAVLMCESNWYCYTPGTVLKHHWETAGFLENFVYDSSAEWTYVELKKPGTLDSNRSVQNLAQILPIQS